MGVFEPSHELRLGLEPLHEPRIIRKLGAHDLDRDLATHARLHRPVHRTERALTDHLGELVTRDRYTGDGCERHVAEHDPMLKIHQRIGGREAGFFGEVIVEFAVRTQRLGLPAAQVQRAHLELDETFPQRLLGDESLEICDCLGVTAAVDEMLGTLFQGQQAQLLEPGHDRPQPPLVGVVAECTTRPERQRTVVRLDRVFRRARTRQRDRQLELRRVICRASEHEFIAVVPRHHVIGTDRGPESVHVRHHGAAGALGAASWAQTDSTNRSALTIVSCSAKSAARSSRCSRSAERHRLAVELCADGPP